MEFGSNWVVEHRTKDDSIKVTLFEDCHWVDELYLTKEKFISLTEEPKFSKRLTIDEEIKKEFHTSKNTRRTKRIIRKLRREVKRGGRTVTVSDKLNIGEAIYLQEQGLIVDINFWGNKIVSISL